MGSSHVLEIRAKRSQALVLSAQRVSALHIAKFTPLLVSITSPAEYRAYFISDTFSRSALGHLTVLTVENPGTRSFMISFKTVIVRSRCTISFQTSKNLPNAQQKRPMNSLSTARASDGLTYTRRRIPGSPMW